MVAYLQDQAAVAILQAQLAPSRDRVWERDSAAGAGGGRGRQGFFPVRPLLRDNYETGSQCSLEDALQEAFQPSQVGIFTQHFAKFFQVLLPFTTLVVAGCCATSTRRGASAAWKKTGGVAPAIGGPPRVPVL